MGMCVKLKIIVTLLIVFVDSRAADSLCVLPISYGTWLSSSRGTWNISTDGSLISNFKAALTITQSTTDLFCESVSGKKYLLRSSIQLFGDLPVDVYICLSFKKLVQSATSYLVYMVTEYDLIIKETFSTNISIACSSVNYETPQKSIVIVKKDNIIDAITTLPDAIQGNYSVTLTDQNGNASNDTLMDSCTDKSSIIFSSNSNTSTKVSSVGFSESGVLHAIYSIQNNNITYLYTYNNDSTVNNINTYRFVCLALTLNLSVIVAKVYPEQCQDINFMGNTYSRQLLMLTPFVTVVEDTAKSLALILVLSILGGLLLVVVLVIVICCIIKKTSKKDAMVSLVDKEDVLKQSSTENMCDIMQPKSFNEQKSESEDVSGTMFGKTIAIKETLPVDTRTIASQAAIWRGPIEPFKRTIAKLKTKMEKASEKGSSRFIPFVGNVSTRRERAKTIIPTTDNIQVYENETTETERPRELLRMEIEKFDKMTKHTFSSAFEKIHPFPLSKRSFTVGDIKSVKTNRFKTVEERALNAKLNPLKTDEISRKALTGSDELKLELQKLELPQKGIVKALTISSPKKAEFKVAAVRKTQNKPKDTNIESGAETKDSNEVILESQMKDVRNELNVPSQTKSASQLDTTIRATNKSKDTVTESIVKTDKIGLTKLKETSLQVAFRAASNLDSADLKNTDPICETSTVIEIGHQLKQEGNIRPKSKIAGNICQKSKKECNMRPQSNIEGRVRPRSVVKVKRPTSLDAHLGVKLNHSGSVKKSFSAGSRSVKSYNYNSPYALSESQQMYLAMKRLWMKEQVQMVKHRKNELKKMRQQENAKAFEEWLTLKHKHLSHIRQMYSRTYSTLIPHRVNGKLTESIDTSQNTKNAETVCSEANAKQC